MQQHHDMGGLTAGTVERREHDYAPWEKQVDALMRLLSDNQRKLITVDQLRRGIESLGPGIYDETTYYERWIASLTQLMIERGVISVDELGRKMADVQARHERA